MAAGGVAGVRVPVPVLAMGVRFMTVVVMGMVVIVMGRVRSHGGVAIGLRALESLEQLQSQVPTLTVPLLPQTP